MAKNYIFFYGTLRQYEYNYERFLEQLVVNRRIRHVGLARTESKNFTMMLAGAVPYLFKDFSGKLQSSVVGDVFEYETVPQQFRMIHDMEIASGYSMEKTMVVSIDDGQKYVARIYLATDTVKRHFAANPHPIVKSGDYVKEMMLKRSRRG